MTAHPTSEWILQQLRETFAESGPYRDMVLDHDSEFNTEVISFLECTGLTPKRTSVQAPGAEQNGIAEPWGGVAAASVSTT